MATVIVKNITGSSIFIEDLGIEVLGNDQLILSELFEFEDISGSNDLKDLVNNDTFIINDGTSDLSKSNSLLHIYHQTVYEDSFEDGGGSGVGSDLSAIQVRRTTDISLSTSWQDVTFNLTNLENNSIVIEHDNTNTDRILIKSNGVYFISYSFTARSFNATRDCLSRIRVNDDYIADGSYVLQNLYKNETHQQDTSLSISLNDGDYITLQVASGSTPITAYADFVLNIFKMDGVKGDSGEAGSTGAEIRSDDHIYTGTSWSNIPYIYTDIESHSNILEHDNSNNDRIICKESGYYLVTNNLVLDDGKVETKILINNIDEVDGSYSYNDPSSSDEGGIYNNTIVHIENDNDFITVQVKGESSNTHIELSHVTITKLQGAKGDTGSIGATGPRGESFSIDEYNDLDEAKVTDIQDNSGASSSDVYFIVVVDDNRSNQNLPSSITGDMTGHILMYDGSSWYDFGQFTGVAGNDGNDGHGWFSGSIDPTSGLYENDDHYLNTTSGEIFKKISGSWSSIGNLSGPQGIQGNDGDDGNFVTVQKDDSTIMTNVAIINFEGDVEVDTSSGSKVNVNIASKNLCSVYHHSNSINVNNSTPVALPFNEQQIVDSIFTHNKTTNNSRIYTSKSGYYKLTYVVNYDGESNRRNVHSYIRSNGSNNLILTSCYAYSRNSTDDKATNSIETIIHLDSGIYIELMNVREGSSGNAYSITDECWLILELIRED